MTHRLQPYRFAVVAEWIVFHPELSSTAVRVFAALARYADDNDECWPSATTLAERLHTSADTIRRGLRQLEEAGAIEVTARYDGDGSQRSNLYRLATLAQLVVPVEGSLFDEPEPAAMPGGALGNTAEGPSAATRNKRKPVNERTNSAALAALVPHAPHPVSSDATLTTNQRANRFMRAYWEWFEEKHGRKPVGLGAVAFSRLIAPFIEAGVSEVTLGAAIKQMDAAGIPYSRQSIDRELRGRTTQPRDNVSVGLAGLRFDEAGNRL